MRNDYACTCDMFWRAARSDMSSKEASLICVKRRRVKGMTNVRLDRQTNQCLANVYVQYYKVCWLASGVSQHKQMFSDNTYITQ